MMVPGDLEWEDVESMADDPVMFIEDVLGEKLWWKQKQIVESVRDNKRTCVASCHGSGKTNVAARCALWWLYTHPNSVVVTTAPTLRQVTKQLWKEIRIACRRANLDVGGSLMPKAPEFNIDGEEWMMIGYSTDSADSFQGWHSEGGNLFIFDEATGIDAEIWEAVRGCLTSPRDRLLAIGNPTDPSSMFAEQFKREDVSTIHISAFEVPNVVEEREVIPGLVSHSWVNEMQEECGPSYEQHPDYIARVLGKFPDKDDRALVPLAWLDAAEERWRQLEDEQAWNTAVSLGVDVAVTGRAKTIFAVGHSGQGVRELIKEPGQSTMNTVGRVIEVGRETGASSWRIDSVGVGQGVHDRCAEIDERRTVAMVGGGKSEAVDKDGNPRYANLRAEWYWTLRERLDPQLDNPLALPPDRALRAQLSSIRWSNTSRGLKKIESKDEMQKRGLRSPDEADAVVYSQAMPSENSYDVIDHLSAMTAL
jgi:phage terminase large subunit